ncbi:Hypothetical protein CINCED_3A008901 [Cinara cedri]|uniref:DDE 3 domain-containing protein n=1 Tax=Cinara cedri TaxID=506608 RepID=A0A5E4M0H1_9HEMI|nr:Hypothetical protein CINCED_3A008901 [Cinara cedri]
MILGQLSISMRRWLIRITPKGSSSFGFVPGSKLVFRCQSGVQYSPLETLSELRERVKQLVPRQKVYELDQIALEMEHEVMRLPPYHCQYNPIELIWAQPLYAVTVDNWKSCMSHCEKLQDEDFRKGLRDEILGSIILTINPDEDSDYLEEEDGIDY